MKSCVKLNCLNSKNLTFYETQKLPQKKIWIFQIKKLKHEIDFDFVFRYIKF
jgi:hypothetical protein